MYFGFSLSPFNRTRKISQYWRYIPYVFITNFFVLFITLILSKIISILLINNFEILSSINVPTSYQLDTSITSLINKFHTNPSIFLKSLIPYYEENRFKTFFSWPFILSLSSFSIVYLRRRDKSKAFYNIFTSISLISSAFYLTHLPIVLTKTPSNLFRTSLPAQLFCLLLFFNFLILKDLFYSEDL